MEDYTNKTRTQLVEELKILHQQIDDLKQIRELIQSVESALPDSMLLLNRDCDVVDSVTGEQDLPTYFGQISIGGNVGDILPPDITTQVKAAVNNAIITGETQVLAYPVDESGGRKWYEARISSLPLLKEFDIAAIFLARDITVHKEMEENLRLSDTTLKSIHDAVFAMDNEFSVTYWNNTCEEIFGIKAGNVIGKYIGDVIKMEEEHPGQNQERMAVLIDKGHNWEEQIYITPKGKVWVDVRVQAIEQDGIRYGWVTLASDISQRKKVEEELKLSEERFSKAFRSVPESIILSRMEDGLYMEINDSFTRLTGFTREEITGKTAYELGAWAEIDDRKKVLDLLKVEGRVENYETDVRKKSGEIAHCLITIEPITINEEACMISVITDVTERKKAEEQIRYQASLVENVTDAIISHDDAFIILSWNKAAERMFGLKREEAIGRDFRDLSEPEYVNPDDVPVPEALEKFGVWTGESVHHLKNGTQLYLRVSIQKVVESVTGKPIYVIILSDISREKKAEDELKELLEREKSLRMEIENEMNKRIELAAGIVHELKTPLTAIISSSELIVENIGDGIFGRIAQNINQSAYDLDRRTGELLDMASGEVGMLHIEKIPLDFRKLLKSMEIELNTYLARKNISLDISIARNLPVISADEERLRQVLLNLIDNAFKFTPEHGRVAIKVMKDDSGIVTEIRDNGIGLSEEDQKYIFKPYSQVTGSSRPVGGLGLGLAIARNLVEAHNGRMWVKSEKGKGSSFFFFLPVGG